MPRAGIRTVILPQRNERDLEDVPAELRGEMEFIFADSAEEFVPRALADGTAASALAAGSSTPTPLPRSNDGAERRSARASAKKRGGSQIT
ncbi:MAG: hypothetical protein H0V00_07630 [Chloroflexia bacterium]|nr:hypothetical protein [Chloroflexia bacterium]